MKVAKYNAEGSQLGEIDVDDSVFNVQVNKGLIYEVIRAEDTNKRQGNASTKGRSFVSGGGAKPWRQKGTGRARQGSTRATQWVGGGIPHGSKARDFQIKMPQKMRHSAFRSILSFKANEGSLRVLDQFQVYEPKTRLVAEMLKKMEVKSSVTFLFHEDDKNLKLAMRNIPYLKYLHVSRLSGRDLFYNKEIIATEGAIREIEKSLKLESKDS